MARTIEETGITYAGMPALKAEQPVAKITGRWDTRRDSATRGDASAAPRGVYSGLLDYTILANATGGLLVHFCSFNTTALLIYFHVFPDPRGCQRIYLHISRSPRLMPIYWIALLNINVGAIHASKLALL